MVGCLSLLLVWFFFGLSVALVYPSLLPVRTCYVSYNFCSCPSIPLGLVNFATTFYLLPFAQFFSDLFRFTVIVLFDAFRVLDVQFIHFIIMGSVTVNKVLPDYCVTRQTQLTKF